MRRQDEDRGGAGVRDDPSVEGYRELAVRHLVGPYRQVAAQRKENPMKFLAWVGYQISGIITLKGPFWAQREYRKWVDSEDEYGPI